MKTTPLTSRFILFLLCIGFTAVFRAQTDTIYKVNGDKISCTISEVGNNGVSYKKTGFSDGPLFVDSKTDILFIRYRNGEKQVFKPAADQTSMSHTTLTQNANQNPAQTNAKNKGPVSTEHKIVFDGKKYYVNGQRVGSRDVDRLLSRSQNPVVIATAKTAKLTKIFQKVTKITAFPSTISGGAASISTFRTVYIEAQNGGAQPSSWINAGLSFVGTLAFPVTAKLLKKQQTKLYDKSIDLYNLDKK